MNNERVSVIIPSYNRFQYLLNAIDSIKNQTHKDIEIIVINDCSTQKDYYTYSWDDIKVIHLPKNSKELFGFVCTNYVRNQGIYISTGKYIAFCDDDDIWFPRKLEFQVNAMKKSGCKMSSTEGLLGKGVYDPMKKYPLYNTEACYDYIRRKYRNIGSNILENGYPEIWNLAFLKVHNCMITSSVMIEKEILTKINYMNHLPNGTGDDYDCWLHALEHTNSVYVNEVCFYYDEGHGNGQDY
jgi:glycosyltransferase involved in cell wall biosynthesis